MSQIQYQETIYKASSVVVFKKTKELYGGLSNMSAGYPIKINGVSILTSEALYQACRFPHLPDVQKAIINQKSPMAAKMVGKPYRSQTRADFEDVKVDIMRWCMHVKLAQNYLTFERLLLSTKNKEIVEDSHKDRFWGAVRDKEDPKILRGCNILGKLLVELRQACLDSCVSTQLYKVEPLALPDFKLYGEDIDVVQGKFRKI